MRLFAAAYATVFQGATVQSGGVAGPPLWAQDLAPRAYVITPVSSNAATFTYSFYDGGVNFNGVVPVTNATGTFSVPVFSLYHSFSFFGRSANILGALPYGVGYFQGELNEQHRQIYRSRLMDFALRVSVNLKGGPAMEPAAFAKWKQKVLLGVSLKIIAPTGQYDPTKLINWGINRWAFKPEIGYSRRWGNWLVDGYAGVWLYTTNEAFISMPKPAPQTESPIGSFEAHLSYDFPKERAWASLDGNFWFGGATGLNGVANPATKQTSSRIGGTASIPLSKHQAIKFSYSTGTYIRFGGNYQTVSAAWQYHWLGWPK